MANLVEFTNAVTGEKTMLDIDNRLTPENCIQSMKNALLGRKPNLETMMKLSFFLDYAISTKNIALISAVHDLTDRFYLSNFS